MDGPVPVEESSGNVFADLGLSNPEERLLKAELGRQIRRLVDSRGLTQAGIGLLLGLAQPHVSELINGKMASLSVERLVGYLNALGQDIDIVVMPAEDQTRGRTRVTMLEQSPVPMSRTAR